MALWENKASPTPAPSVGDLGNVAGSTSSSVIVCLCHGRVHLLCKHVLAGVTVKVASACMPSDKVFQQKIAL